MRKLIRLAVGRVMAAAAVMALPGCSAVQPGGQLPPAAQQSRSVRALETQLDALLADPVLEQALVGAAVRNVATGESWYDHNANRLFVPASNQKLATAVAALRYLGPEFQFTTELKYRGTITPEGVLEGDVLVIGHGDPTLYTRFYERPTELFELWAESLRQRGVQRITGDIIGDDNAWDDAHVHWSWPQDLGAWYYAEFGPLQVNENYVDVKFTPPAAADGEVLVEPNLASSYYTLETDILVATEGTNTVELTRTPGTNDLRGKGRVRAGSDPFEQTVTITNPTLFYATVLKETMERSGIAVDGAPRDVDDVAGWTNSQRTEFTTLGTAKSPLLREIVKTMLKRSQNNYAETLLMTMGWRDTGTGSHTSGSAVIRRQLQELGLRADSYVLADGSGLSRHNLMTPDALVQILTQVHATTMFDDLHDALPIAGVDGTLTNRMRGTAAEGRARAKTGLLVNARSLSGYVYTAGGELLAFSFLVNNHNRTSAEIDAIIDRAVVALAEYNGT